VTGQAPRIIALFNYANEPHYQFSDQIRQRFFGRVSPLGELSSTTADTP